MVSSTSGDPLVFVDGTTIAGVTYRYTVSANGLPPQGERCDEVPVTAVPFFGLALGALTLSGMLVAFVLMRRRA